MFRFSCITSFVHSCWTEFQQQNLNKTTANKQTDLASRGYTIPLPTCTISSEVMQLVSSHPTITLSQTDQLQSVFHICISCNLHFMLLSAAIFMVCILPNTYNHLPRMHVLLSTTVYKCDVPLFKANCFIHLIHLIV